MGTSIVEIVGAAVVKVKLSRSLNKVLVLGLFLIGFVRACGRAALIVVDLFFGYSHQFLILVFVIIDKECLLGSFLLD